MRNPLNILNNVLKQSHWVIITILNIVKDAKAALKNSTANITWIFHKTTSKKVTISVWETPVKMKGVTEPLRFILWYYLRPRNFKMAFSSVPSFRLTALWGHSS